MNESLQMYGAKVNSIRTRETLTHIFRRNEELNMIGKRGTPICIWGTHGIGKTQIVKDFANSNKWHFEYFAPAQVEEMGDLHGLPQVFDPDPTVVGDERTIYAKPDWVPTVEGPGILLIDDFNRADDRILRGIMQLLQNFELFSWQLPPKWQIVLTANPEGGEYSVTPVDDSMVTRMLHISMIFDVKAWARWAYENRVDGRGIAFVLSYPEIVNNKRTTPRSLTQFFEQIQTIKDLDKEIELVNILAMSSLDEHSAAAFLSFVKSDIQELIEPEDILDSDSFTTVHDRLKKIAGKSGSVRVDRLSVVCTRLFLHLIDPAYKPKANHSDNLISFMTILELPADLRMSLHQDLVKEASEEVKEILRNKRVSEIILKSI